MKIVLGIIVAFAIGISSCASDAIEKKEDKKEQDGHRHNHGEGDDHTHSHSAEDEHAHDHHQEEFEVEEDTTK